MKKNLLYILAFGLLAGTASSCTDDDKDFPQDTAIAEVSLQNLSWKESVMRDEVVRLKAAILNDERADLQWHVDGEAVSTDTIYNFSASEEGVYRVKVTATNSLGSSADSIDIEVADGFGFSSIQNWTGEGDNEAILAIQWVTPDTEDLLTPADEDVLHLAWGYRWNTDEEKFGIDMLRDIAASDPRLFVVLSELSWGTTIYGLGYDGNADGKITVRNPEDNSTSAIELRESDFTDGIYFTDNANGFDGLQATSEGDWWMSGWYEAYASYWCYEGESVTSSTEFEYSNFGVSNRPLSHHCWDAWTFSPINSGAMNISPIIRLLKAAE